MNDLYRFPLGTVVSTKIILSTRLVVRDLTEDYEIIFGHVVGFEQNIHGETIIKVAWANGREYSIHPGNLIKVEKTTLSDGSGLVK